MAESKIDLERYYVNKLTQNRQDKIRDLKRTVEEMREYADIWMEILQEQIECDQSLTGDPGMKLNGSIYNGTAGLAMLDVCLAQKYEMSEADRELLLLRAGTNLEMSLQKLKGRKVSFLGGDAGPLALTICMYYDMAERGCPTQDMVDHYKEKLLSFCPVVLEPCCGHPFGVLCGNAGYLWALLYVAKRCPGLIAADIIQQVVMSIVDNGKPPRSVRQDYLLWNWRGQHVLGAPHGMFGILYVLLKAVDYWPIDDEDLEGSEDVPKGKSETSLGQKRLVEEKHSIMVDMFCTLEHGDESDKRPRYSLVNWILNTLNFLTTQIFASGNTLPALGYSEDKYVNWAFGAPGAIYTFIEAHRIFRTPSFLSAARKAAETIWHRGIVKAGYGLADGVAGNAYALMAMFKYTKEEKYRDQAFFFAEYCYHYGMNDDPCSPPPAYPLSLFEGLPGVIYMLYDFATANPKLPGYEL